MSAATPGPVVILAAGSINHTQLPLGTNQSNATIPVNGKPVISWILDDLLAKGLREAVVVVREEDARLQRLLGYAYAGRLDLRVVPLRDSRSILDSLDAGLRAAKPSGLARILLGDTLIPDPFEGSEDFVYIGEVHDARRWCLAVTAPDGVVRAYLDKQDLGGGPHRALAGYYHLRDAGLLRACLDEALAAGSRELSEVLRRYGAQRPLRAVPASTWYDFGHIDNLADARRRLLRGRYFNALRVDPVLNTITKTSDHAQKLRDELDWYLALPRDLQALTPRILDHRDVEGRLEIVQEYYGYPTLAELYVYGDLHADAWAAILRRIFRVHEEFRRHEGSLEPRHLEAMYLGKTRERLAALAAQDPDWRATLGCPTVAYNGRELKNIPRLGDALWERAAALARSATVSVIHGDLCFSNILYDVNHQIIRLIDPRGSFGARGIHGDPRYDVAKLRHSARGLYDYIVADMFEVHMKGPAEFRGEVYTDGTPRAVAAAFDRMAVESGYDLDELRLLEGLLFVSMAPLHRDHPSRQRMMFLTGLELLNEVV